MGLTSSKQDESFSKLGLVGARSDGMTKSKNHEHVT
jgi:hypothetical protein